jgi:hypothetical protein
MSSPKDITSPSQIADFVDVSSADGNPTVSRSRRAVAETGSFGKSTRRSRSRTGTPAAKREDPTLAAADAIFSQYIAQRAAESSEQPQRKSSLSTSISQSNLSSASTLAQTEGNDGPFSRYTKKEPHKEPTEVILRGFKSNQQYAAINEYERIGGRICEDYPRDPPVEQRRYKSDLRDPAALRQKPLTAEEKAKAMKFAGGEHWIKVTFESAEAAEIAVENSPQTILNHLVYAELYRGVPPTSDEAIDANGKQRTPRADKFSRQGLGASSGLDAKQERRGGSNFPRSSTTPSMRQIGGGSSLSPSDSQASSQTVDSGTIASTATSATITAQPVTQTGDELLYCRKIPTAKRMQLLPAEQALLPRPSLMKQTLSNIPLIGWLSSDMIGSSVPRTEQGEFDWKRASLYWKLIWWVDSMTGWFDVCGNDKDE